jgi:F-type H+-transporting ATPase subunit epsilon
VATPPRHLTLEFVTPERPIVHDDVDEVVLPGEDGAIGVLPGHAPLLVAERAEDIDLARAEAAKRRAEDRIAKPSSEIDIERARVALLRALTRVQVSRHTRPRG